MVTKTTAVHTTIKNNPLGLLVREYGKPKLRRPIAIVGLPGIGLVSKLTVDNLVKTLGAKRIASVYSPHFPNQVLSMPNGRLRPFGLYIYCAKVPGGDRDLLLIRGDLQPITVEGQYEVSAAMLQYCAGLGSKTVLAMAGYATNKKEEKPKLFASATHPDLLKAVMKAGSKKSENSVPIVGMAGLMPGLAPLFGMQGSCILVETPGPIVDAAGAGVLTGLIARFIGSKLDASKLHDMAKKTAGMIEQFEKQAKAAEAQGAPVAATPAELIKKDTLSYIR